MGHMDMDIDMDMDMDMEAVKSMKASKSNFVQWKRTVLMHANALPLL